MNLQLNGKCTRVFETEYTSRDGGVKKKHHFVLDVADERYPMQVCFTVLDGERYAHMGITQGVSYNVSFNIQSREYNGRWYTDIMAWNAIRLDGAAQRQSANVGSPLPY